MFVGGGMYLGGWDVTVLSVSERSEAPTGEFVQVAVQMRARYGRSGAGRFDRDVTVSAIGPTGVTYLPTTEECSDALPIGRGAEIGDEITGHICFTVNHGDAPSLLVVVEAVDGRPHRVYLSTTPTASLDCTLELESDVGESQTDQASVVLHPGGSADLSVPPYHANIVVEEGASQVPLALRFHVIGPHDFSVQSRGEADPSAAPGTRQAWGSAEPGSGDHLSWECIGP